MSYPVRLSTAIPTRERLDRIRDRSIRERYATARGGLSHRQAVEDRATLLALVDHLGAAMREVSAQLEAPGSREESEVDAVREVVRQALGGGT